jgi:cell division protein FtsW
MAKKRSEKGLDAMLLISVLALLGIGLVMVHSSSSVATLTDYGDSFYYLKRQGMFAGLGLGALVVASQFDYRRWNDYALIIMGGSLLILLAVLHPSIGVVVNGARRWIELGGFRFQPSELVKVALILFTASGLAYNQKRIQHLVTGAPYVALTAGVCVLILLQPDLGTAIAVGGTAFFMWFVAGFHGLHLVGLLAIALPAGWKAMMMEEYRRDRFLAFLNPWADPLGDGYHIIQSLLALGSGGLFGVGLGNSRQKLFYLPERHTDFIFAILGEELGLVGAFLVIFLFGVFAYRGFRVAMQAPDGFGTLLAAGITSMVIFQALINIGVVTGSIPITGITLPFISYGGSSLVPTLGAVGILLNVSRYTREKSSG